MNEFVADLFEQIRIALTLQEQDYRRLLERYDDLSKRCHDLQAELEYLRQEVKRG